MSKTNDPTPHVLWDILDKGNQTNKTLLNIIQTEDSQLQEEAWVQFKMQNPTADQLCSIIETAPLLREKAAEMLLALSPNIACLRLLIQYIPSRTEDCWQLIQQDSPNKEKMYDVIECIKQLRTKAWEWILLNNPTKKDLNRAVSEAPNWQKIEAGEKLIHNQPTIKDLRFVAKAIPTLREECAQQLLRKGNCSDNDLMIIIQYGNSSDRDNAAQQLHYSARNLSKKDLALVVTHVPSFKKEQWKRISQSWKKIALRLKRLLTLK